MKIRQTTIITMLLVFASIAVCFAADCPSCGAKDISGLAMFCPECASHLHNPVLRNAQEKSSSLKIRLLYTGNKPERIPPYGKLFINGRYRGNIDLIEKQVPGGDYSMAWASGLGKDFSAYYEKELKNLPTGVLRIEVEMKFDRLYGFGRSYKRVVFPYVSFNKGEKTVLEHYFNAAATFHRYEPGKQVKIPVVSEAKIQGASGTVALNVPLFR